jgi:hypothetical protein
MELIMMRNLTTAQNTVLERIFMDYLEAGLEGLSGALGQWPILFDENIEPFSENGFGLELAAMLEGLDGRAIPLRGEDPAPVAAVDASVVKLAETPLGPVIGLKAAVVERFDSVRISIIGPFLKLVRLNASRASNVFTAVKDEFRLFERLVQLWISKNVQDRIVLLDGTLTVSADRCGHLLAETLEEACRRGNMVIAFAKESGLLRGVPLLQTPPDPPCIVEITDIVRKAWAGLRCLGAVYLAILSHTIYPVRAEAYPVEKGVAGFSRLLTSDVLRHGYPETLALAHLYSGFNWLDIVAARGALLTDYQPRIAEMLSPRESFLAPFERGHREDPS